MGLKIKDFKMVNGVNFKIYIAFVLLIGLSACKSLKNTSSDSATKVTTAQVSSITNKSPYDPNKKKKKLREKYEQTDSKGNAILKEPIHFLVFGDSKGSIHLNDVLKRADLLAPQFCLTTADLVNKGGGEIGEKLYQELDSMAGWFLRKYPTWPTLGNHEVSGPKSNTRKENYTSGVQNFGDFFGLKNPLYSFIYGNSKFIALDWIKVSESPERLEWLEKELKAAQGMQIFVFKHRPYYTVGNKSYKDVEGKSTVATRLFTKYKVTAVFSGHDHLYHRTERDGVNYIVSAGAGARIYQLKRESDALPGDAYYGREVGDENKYRFHSSEGEDISFNEAMYFVLSVKVDGKKVTFEMIDTEGKTWDKFTFMSDI